MENIILRKTTSLTLIAIMVAGGMTFAVPGAVPSAYANALYVSAESSMFENYMTGGQVIEVIVNDAQYRTDENRGESFKPIVTVDDHALEMDQASNGNWYGYFADMNMAATAQASGAFNYGMWNEEMMAYEYTSDRNVLEEPGVGNPDIQVFDFLAGDDFDVELENAQATETVTLEFDTVEDYAGLVLDRNTYPLNTQVHITITDTWLNIDPTSEDWWTFETYEGSDIFYRIDHSSAEYVHPAVPTDDLMCDDNCVLIINPNKQGSGTTVTIQDNTDSAATVADGMDASDPFNWEVVFDDEIERVSIIPAGHMPVTVYESGSNTGVFSNTDSDDTADLVTTGDKDLRGKSATIDYNDEETDILVGFGFASVEMMDDGMWSSGEILSIVITDDDSNRNGASDEDMMIHDPLAVIPALMTGSPFTITDGTTYSWSDGDGEHDADQAAYDRFSAIGVADMAGADGIESFTIHYDMNYAELADVVIDNPKVFSYFNYDFDAFDSDPTSIQLVNSDGDVVADLPMDGSEGYGHLDTVTVDSINDESGDVMIKVSFNSAGLTYADSAAVAADFMSFGYVDDGVQGSERVANQVVRLEAEETDDNTGVFEATLEYVMVNQLNILDQGIYDDVTTSSDTPVFIVMEDLTDEDSPRVSFSDLGADGVVTQVSDQVEAPSHSGVVSFDNSRYKVADTVVITLEDSDLNVDADVIDIYTIVQNSDSDVYGKIGDEVMVPGTSNEASETFGPLGRLLDVTFDDSDWPSTSNHSDCIDTLRDMGVDTGLHSTGFTLVETDPESGVFVGDFQIPSDWCQGSDTRPQTTTGLDIEVNYLDFRDASGEIIEVGDSAAVGANTGSISLDRTVYPVPFGEPMDFSARDMLNEELMQTEDRNQDIAAYTALRDLVDDRANYIDEPAESGSDFRNAVADEGLTDVLRSVDSDWIREIDASDQWRELDNELDDMIDALEDMTVRDTSSITKDITEVEDDLHYMSEQGASPDGKSYFALHSTSFDEQGNSPAYVTSGDLTIHIRITDPDFDVSAQGHDSIAMDDAPVIISVIREADTYIVGCAGTSEDNCGSLGRIYFGPEPVSFGPLEEIAPDAGIFEIDVPIRYTDGPSDNNCPSTVDYHNESAQEMVRQTGEHFCILQGDILQVEYEDPIDASGDRNTVTDSATFDLRNGVLQSDKTSYLIGTDMILTLIEPDFDLDNDQAETYDLDLIEWDSDAATLTMGNRGGEAAAFDPEPTSLRETGDSTGIFQTIIEIPEELEGDRLERNEAITLEYTDWGPSGADYVGQEDEDVTLNIMTSDFGATIELDQKVYTWTDKVYITIVAPDHNYDSDLVDEIGNTETDPLKVSTRGHDLDRYKLVETGTDTGIFTGEVILTGFSAHDADSDGEPNDARGVTGTSDGLGSTKDLGPTNGFLATSNDDGLSVSYEYSEDITIVASALIRWNIGEVQWLESSYPATGTGVVRVIDPDMNLNPEAVDNFDIDVWSDSDAGGIDLTVTETNEATGIFEGTVAFTTETESSGHRLRTAEGDTVTAEYEDRTLPDPYNMRDDLDVTATTLIGTVVPPLERAPASNLRVVDSFGNSLDSVAVDQQVQITADLMNGQDRNQAFAYLVQVQDANGVVVSLAWITGTLNPQQSLSPAESWAPSAPGMYTATAFVWESLDNPTALSPPISVDIIVE